MEDPVEFRLTKIENKLDAIHSTLASMAIQGEQINNLKAQQDTLWRKYDKLAEDIACIYKWQASCPRDDIAKLSDYTDRRFSWMWTVIIPIAFTIMAMGYQLIRLSHGSA
jgi:flagellar biosynthesis/type III secretory pathway chaperone